MNKRLICFLLSVVMLIGLLPAAVSAEPSNPFRDVPRDAWYWQDVTTAYADKLINGKTADTFAPNDNLTYAEAVKLAACMHQKYRDGMITIGNGDPWYQTYVDYCKTNGIIDEDYSWNDPATRAGYMSIFAGALPNLDAANTVEDNGIPDVQKGHPQYDAIYKLYRAGILQGVDSAHNCNPSGNIKRSEVAAILTRMMYLDQRISFTVVSAAADGKLTVTVTPDKYTDKNNTMTFKAVATGGKPAYDYQWAWKNDDNPKWTPFNDFKLDCGFSGAATDTFTLKLTDTQRAKNFVIFCVVGDAAGGIAPSNEVAISPVAAAESETEELKIVKQPDKLLIGVEGAGVDAFVEVAGGVKPYSFRWQRCSQEVWEDLTKSAEVSMAFSGTVGTLSLRIGKNDWTTNEDLRCVITDAAGNSVTTEPFRAGIKTGTLKIAKQPAQDLSGADGETVTASVGVTGGTAPYTFLWQSLSQGEWETLAKSSDVDYSANGTAGTLSVRIGKNDWTTNEDLRCVITDAAGNSVTSESFRLSIRADALRLASQSGGEHTTVNGAQEVLSVEAAGGTAPYSFLWQRFSQGEWEAIAETQYVDISVTGATGTLILLISANDWTTNEDLRCVVTDAAGGTVISDTVRFRIDG